MGRGLYLARFYTEKPCNYRIARDRYDLIFNLPCIHWPVLTQEVVAWVGKYTVAHIEGAFEIIPFYNTSLLITYRRFFPFPKEILLDQSEKFVKMNTAIHPFPERI